MSGVTIQNLSKIFPKEDGTVTQALESVDLEIQDKEFVCLVGRRGAGRQRSCGSSPGSRPQLPGALPSTATRSLARTRSGVWSFRNTLSSPGGG